MMRMRRWHQVVRQGVWMACGLVMAAAACAQNEQEASSAPTVSKAPLEAAAGAPPSRLDRAAQAVDGEPVRYANRTVAAFRTSYLGMSPAERARRSAANIERALDQGGEGVVTVQATPQGTLVLIDGMMVIILHSGDVDPLSGDTLEALAARTADALRLSVQETREARNARTLLVSAAWVAGATGVAVVLYHGLAWVRRKALAFLFDFARRHAHRLGGGAGEVLRLGRLHHMIQGLDTMLRWSVGGLLAYTWLSYCLQRFPYTRPWGEGLHHHLIGVVLDMARAMAGAVPGLIVAALILLLARAAAGVVASLFHRVEQGQVGVGWISQDAAGPTRRIATWVIWLFALAMAYPYLPGSETEAFKGISVLVGLMMSLGASSFVGQVAGGLILTYSSMLRKGEYVRIGDHEGTVVDIGAFNTRIRTGLGEEIILPNSMIVSSPTKNYSREVKGAGYIMDTVVTIGYDTPWRQVEAMLIEAARRTPDVLADPAPRVFQTALSDYYPEYRLVCQAIPEQPRPRAEIMSALHANIQDVFNEHGVQIMSPHYVLDPAQEKVVPPDRWYLAPARRPDGGVDQPPPRAAA